MGQSYTVDIELWSAPRGAKRAELSKIGRRALPRAFCDLSPRLYTLQHKL